MLIALSASQVMRPDLSGSNLAHMKDLLMLVANEPEARDRSEHEYRSLLDVSQTIDTFPNSDGARVDITDRPSRLQSGGRSQTALATAQRRST